MGQAVPRARKQAKGSTNGYRKHRPFPSAEDSSKPRAGIWHPAGQRAVIEAHALEAGEHIEAWHNGRLFHRGTVVKTVAGTGLFWLQDDAGNRRLLDLESLEIVRDGEEAPAGLPEPTPATVTPISLFPVFQDGSQAIA